MASANVTLVSSPRAPTSQGSPRSTNSKLSPRGGPPNTITLTTFSPKRAYPKPELVNNQDVSSDDELASTLHQLRRIGSTLVKRVTDVELSEDSHSSRALTPLRRRSECGGFAMIDVSPDATARWRKRVADGTSGRGSPSRGGGDGGGGGGGATSGHRSARPPNSSPRADRSRLPLVTLTEANLPSGETQPKCDEPVSCRSAGGGRMRRSASLASSTALAPASPRSVSRERVSRRSSLKVTSPLIASSFRFGNDEMEHSMAESAGGTARSVNGSRRASSYYREYTERQLEQQPALRRLRNVQSKVHMAESILCNALADASDRPPRSAEERRRDAVELEKAKLILFVGRKYNLEERITALLTVVEEQRKSAAQDTTTTTRSVSSADRARQLQPRAIAEAVKELDALVLDDKVGGGHKGIKYAASSRNAATMNTTSTESPSTAAPATNPMATSTTSTVGSNAPVVLSDNFNPSRLRRIIDRFAAELDEVARHVEPGAEESVMRMRQSLYTDTFSNFKDMCWLIESLDSIFISDEPTPEGTTGASGVHAAARSSVQQAPAKLAALPQQQASGRRATAGTAVGSQPRRGSAPDGTAAMRTSVFLTGTDGVLDSGEQGSLSRPSLEQTNPSSADPSLVPFSLFSSQLDVGLDGAAGPRRSTMAHRRESHFNHLHLLGFMEDAVPDSYIEAIDAQRAVYGGRPISAPATTPSSHGVKAANGSAPAEHAQGHGWLPSSQAAYKAWNDVEGADGTQEKDDDDDEDGPAQDTSNEERSSRPAGASTASDRQSNASHASGPQPLPQSIRGIHTGASTGAAGDGVTTKPALPLAHIRHDLLEDLKKLYKVFNYDGLVTQRREEVVDANVKSQEDYAAEMEAKIQQQLERRQQALAAAVAAREPDEYGLSSLAGHPASSKGRPGTTQSNSRPRAQRHSQLDAEADEALLRVDVLLLDSDEGEEAGGDADGTRRRRDGDRPPRVPDAGTHGAEDEAFGDLLGMEEGGESGEGNADTRGRANSNADRCVVMEETVSGGLTFTLFGEYLPGTSATTGPTAKKETTQFGQYMLQVQNNSDEPVQASVTVLANKLKSVQIDSMWPGVRKGGLAYLVSVPPSCVRRLLTFVPDSKAAGKKGAKGKKNKTKSAVTLAPPPPSTAFVFERILVNDDEDGSGSHALDEDDQAPDAAYSPLMAGGHARLPDGVHDDLDDVRSDVVSPNLTPNKVKPSAPKPAPPRPSSSSRPAAAPATKAATTTAAPKSKPAPPPPTEATKSKPKTKAPVAPAVPSRPEHKVGESHPTSTTHPEVPLASTVERAATPQDVMSEEDVAMLNNIDSPLKQFVFPLEPPEVEDWGKVHPNPTVEAIENNCVTLAVLQSEGLAKSELSGEPRLRPLDDDQASDNKPYSSAHTHAGDARTTPEPPTPEKVAAEAVQSALTALELPADVVGVNASSPHGSTQLSPFETAPLTADALAEAVVAKLTKDAWQDVEADATQAHPHANEAGDASTGGGARHSCSTTLPIQLQDVVLATPAEAQRLSQSLPSARDAAEKLVTALSNSALQPRHSFPSSGVGSGGALVGGWMPPPSLVLSSASSHPLMSMKDVLPYGTVAGVHFDRDVARDDEAARRQSTPSGAFTQPSPTTSTPAGPQKTGSVPSTSPRTALSSAGRDRPQPVFPGAASRPASASTAGASVQSAVYGSEIIVRRTPSPTLPSSATHAEPARQSPHNNGLPPLAEGAPTRSSTQGSRTPPSTAATATATLPPVRRSAPSQVKPSKAPTKTRVPPPLPAPRYQLAHSGDGGEGDDGDEEALKNLLRGPVAPPPIVTTKSADTGAVNVFLPPDAERMGLYEAVLHKTNPGQKKKHRGQGSTKSTRSRAKGAAAGGGFKLDDDEDESASHAGTESSAQARADRENEPVFVSNVKTFLNRVAHTTDVEAGRNGPSGGKLASSVPVTATVAGAVTAAVAAPVYSEMQFLEEQARELYRQDPLRFDTVMDDLITKAMSQMKAVAKEDADAAADAAAAAAASSVRKPSRSSHNTTSRNRRSSHDEAVRPTMPVSAITFDLEGGGQGTHANDKGRARQGRHTSVIMLGASTDTDHTDTTASPSGYRSRTSRYASAAHTASAANGRVALQRISEVELHDEARKGGLADIEAGKDEVQNILYEQMKAKLMLRAIIAQMQRLWATKEAEKDARAKEVMRRTFERAEDVSWQFEKRRVVNLHKLIHLLDRRVGRVGGWIPVYNDMNVLTDARGFSEPTMDPTSYRARVAKTYSGAGTRTLNTAAVPMSTMTIDGTGLAFPATPVLCEPQQRLRHAMCLAKRRRLLPVRLLRQQIGEEWNKHLLFGYKKHVLSTDVAQRQSGHFKTRFGEPWHPFHFRDMETTAERLRYRRRLQGAAPFQTASKMYSPRLKRDQDIPFTK